MEKKLKSDLPETDKKMNGNKKLFLVLGLLLALGLLSLFFAAILSGTGLNGSSFNLGGKVALIRIEGEIGGSSSIFSSGVNPDSIISLIKKAEDDTEVRAVIFEINSPGGSPVATEEIANAIKGMKKPKICYIRDVGASGAYWIASSADRIFASRMSEVGSIGVIGSYVEFAGLMDRYNLTYRRLVSGKYKDMGSPLKEMTPEEQDLVQTQLDYVHSYFIDTIAANRNLSRSKVEELATGEVFFGARAKELGLIDDFGGKEEAKKYLEAKFNTTLEISEMKPEKTFMDLFSEVSSQQSYSMGRGIGDSLTNPKVGAQGVTVRT